MEKSEICECCGSSNTEIKDYLRHFDIPFGETLTYRSSVVHCKDCNEDVEIPNKIPVEEFLSAKNPSYVKAIELSVNRILSNLKENNISQSHIERTFGIPQKNISKWISEGNIPTTALSLLRILNTFPWILNVAEKNYNESKCHNIALTQESKYFLRKAEESGNKIEASICCRTNCVSLNMKITNPENKEHEFFENPQKNIYFETKCDISL